jgi:hypothetical protein
MGTLHDDDPRQLGPYRITGRLGVGGMGTVFRGEKPGGEIAAIKVVHPHLSDDDEFRARFGREIATAQRVWAPWTAAVLGADPTARPPWLATAFVAGPALGAAVAAGGPVTAEQGRSLASCLAEALTALHAGGVVHRDLKPSNVLLAADGPRLIDFGIAQALDATRITRTGMVLGTPAYMSPEQALGEPVGPESDVFSLASVIAFAVTGSGPFGTTTNAVAMLRRIAAQDPDLSAVPPHLRDVLAPCFARDPRARPTAAALRARLGAPGPWTRPTTPTLVGPPEVAPRRRRRGAIVAAALVAVGAIAAATVTVVALNRPAAPAAPPAAAAASATPTLAPSAALLPATAQVALLPSTIPGWRAAYASSRNAAYDVPPSWAPSSPSSIRGFRDDAGNGIVLSGIAALSLDEPCTKGEPGGVPQYKAWAGITGFPSADTAAAARELATRWLDWFSSDDDKKKTAARPGPAETRTVGDRTGSHVAVEIRDNPQGGCASPHATLRVLAVPDGKGQSVVLVVLADLDAPGAVTPAEIDQMLTTLRPAGQQAACRDNKATGTWCS